MCLSRWISLVIAVIYILFFITSFILSGESYESSKQDLFEGAIGLLFWLVLSIGCIWYGDELGEGLLGAKFGLVSETSPGWAVQLIGWILLLLPAGIFLWHLVGAKE
jgi:hypothetical protein